MHEQTDYFSLISEHTPEYERKATVPCWCLTKGMDFGRELNPEACTDVRNGIPCCGSCKDWVTFYEDLERREHAARLCAVGSFNGA